MKHTDKNLITKYEYFQLIGLLTLGKIYNEKLEDLLKAVNSITGEFDQYGHGSDTLYNSDTVDKLLERLDIKTVE